MLNIEAEMCFHQLRKGSWLCGTSSASLDLTFTKVDSLSNAGL